MRKKHPEISTLRLGSVHTVFEHLEGQMKVEGRRCTHQKNTERLVTFYHNRTMSHNINYI